MHRSLGGLICHNVNESLDTATCSGRNAFFTTEVLHLLVHDYLGIDVERVWEIIHRDVPGLKVAVLSALAK